ncbi:hypothetical protein [Leptolyngbya sp. GGD]|jgi:hypothetical protein|uniref:hypothetical protein n=1 Tax=Leptolyngbya sp. GGD TaxID=2997907 RepID=UPI00227C161A|nr:hypothetical protein [Leptolyngbya sp. GGD]MCY6494322.1 hypothetical protein [Leptolyngbya sp. GGD]
MSHNSANRSKKDSSADSTAISHDEIVDQLLFSDSIDELLASGELQVDDLPIDEPIISDESLAFFKTYAAEMDERIARGEITPIIADDF